MFQTEVVEKFETQTNNIFSSENRVVYEITWKNMVEPERPQMTM